MEKYDCDVLVCGGGFGGISAALAAARLGKRVTLLEKQYVLGGLGTAGLITYYLPLCDGLGHQVSFGLAEELLRLSISMGAEDEYPANWLEGIGTRTEKDHRFRVRYNPWLFAMLAERELRPRPTVRRASTPTVRRKWPPSSKSWKTACPSTTTPWSRCWICAII